MQPHPHSKKRMLDGCAEHFQWDPTVTQGCVVQLLDLALGWNQTEGKKEEAKGLVAQSRLTFCNPVDCSPPGSSVHGILQARTLEWAAMSSSRDSSQPWD